MPDLKVFVTLYYENNISCAKEISMIHFKSLPNCVIIKLLGEVNLNANNIGKH